MTHQAVCEIPGLLRREQRQGFVHVYTGNGKGKTTAAFGLALRGAGAGLRVFIGQFVKQGKYSEVHALDVLSDTITCRQYGRGCFIDGAPEKADMECAQRGFEEARRVLEKGEYDIVILDELTIATAFGLLPEEAVLDLLDRRPPYVELVITGRCAPKRLIERADLVTEMREIKHYYNEGILARRGIES